MPEYTSTSSYLLVLALCCAVSLYGQVQGARHTRQVARVASVILWATAFILIVMIIGLIVEIVDAMARGR